MQNFINKYNVAGPRYTSYPTVPYWDTSVPDPGRWADSVKKAFIEKKGEGISLYIHLPFCESLCTYCGCNTRITVNHGVESPYITAILKEWEMYCALFEERPVIKELHLGGGTPTFFSPLNLEMLIRGILSRAEVAENPEFSFEAHPLSTTAAHLQTLYDLGFRRLSLGIQDFDPRVQAIVNRIQSYESVEKVTNEARRIGYLSVNFDLIYGLPLQTEESVRTTIDKVNMLRPDRIAFYSYAHVPWIKPGQRKFTEADLPRDEEKRRLYELGKEKLALNGYMEIGMDHFALRTDSLYTSSVNQSLHRNFMGYTSSKTNLLIGLGASSISDIWSAYGQNVKKVEDYYRLLNSGVLPVFKVHYLTEEDMILRRHILNIMCRMETNWREEELQCDHIATAKQLLAEMEKDELISVSGSALTVHESARPYIRNVCMAFDAHLFNNKPESQIFSTVA